MKKVTLLIKLMLACIITVTSQNGLSAQGCSDAGLCSIDVLKPAPDSQQMQHKNKINAGLLVGAADYDIAVFGGSVGYSRKIGKRWGADTKITFLSQSGNDISVTGMGDIFVNINFIVSQKFTIFGGAKIPLTKADRTYDNKPLPMDYQSSLGTFDVLAGIKYTAEKWQATAGLQLPLQQNENTFVPGLFPMDSPLNSFQNTNEFHRQADVLLHLSRRIPMSGNITVTPGLLAIYHLDEDTYTEYEGFAGLPVIYPITGSDGLTLNATVFFDLEMGESGSLEFNFGFPLVVREARPDGLTRSFVFGVGYSHSF
jgi:hypothetical protein